MTEMARKRRWSRFIDRQSGKALIVPIDHGLTMGPLEGLNRVEEVLRWLNPDVVTGIVAHKGFAQRLGGAPGCGLMIHLNGSLNVGETPDFKRMVTSVEAALRLGADAVSIQTNFSAATADHNLQLIGQVVDQAHAFGLPVLNMVYDKGPLQGKELTHLRHFMRAAVELGVDALKVAAPEDLNRIPELVDGIQEHTPVLFAGGALADELSLLELAAAVVRHDTGGICVGRNVFQRPNPLSTMTRLRDLFRRGVPTMDFSRLAQPEAAELEN
ncbi:class I fructose-bisphosphate aldolase [Chromobacterium sphagni]|uniref:Aldolase n=1 Tax=Chromobacterium sphagni TaxID=1903179 RepID=A0A1S1X1X3_9NEIS|nr:aldolase [Chromobacterium sphagni]OHX13429.1 aldolase [Chromobacterium sphagni]OHX21886.1 aldolase [Chromobacterium sphagni]